MEYLGKEERSQGLCHPMESHAESAFDVQWSPVTRSLGLPSPSLVAGVFGMSFVCNSYCFPISLFKVIYMTGQIYFSRIQAERAWRTEHRSLADRGADCPPLAFLRPYRRLGPSASAIAATMPP